MFCILHFEFFGIRVLYFAFEFFEEGYLRASFRAAETPSQVPNLRIFKYSKAHSPDDLFVFKYVSRKIRKLEEKKGCAKTLLGQGVMRSVKGVGC